MLLLKSTLRKLILGTLLVLISFSFLFFYNLKTNKNIPFRQVTELFVKNAFSVTKNLSSNLFKYSDNRIKNEGNIILFDLDQPLEPENEYKPISCRLSANILVKTTLCIHPVDKDIWVSQNIWTNGYWEPDILGKYLILKLSLSFFNMN
jgi:hypothetical protein